MKKIVNLSSIAALICFIGCSIQIYHITCIYLKFKVRSEVTYDYTDQVELPTIDIIIPITDSINLTELFIRYPKQMVKLCNNKSANIVTADDFNNACLHKFAKYSVHAAPQLSVIIKVKDIKELTIDPREQIDYIKIGNSNFITNLCNLTRYYNGIAVFLRISCTEQAALINDNLNVVGSYGEHIATIGHSFGEHFGIRFSSQLDMPEWYFDDYFMISQKADETSSVWIRYEKIVSRSLPYPYETKCRYYNKYKVQQECVANFTSYNGSLNIGVVNDWDTQPEHLGFIDNINSLFFESKCAESIPVPECEKTTYLIDGGIASELVNEKSGLIFIEKPVTPTMYFNVHPHLLLSEYLIFVGSIIGTWFGIAISMLTLKGSKVIGKIRKSREREMPIKIFTVRNSYFPDPLLLQPRSPLRIHQLIHLESIDEDFDCYKLD